MSEPYGPVPAPEHFTGQTLREQLGEAGKPHPTAFPNFGSYTTKEILTTDEILTTTEDFKVTARPAEDDQTADAFLRRAAGTIKLRGQTYDNFGEERSAGKTADAFNAITGRRGEAALRESDVWLLLQILKDVRQWSKPGFHEDSALDCVSYSALKAESLARGG